ncbi:MAG: hypothetical protein A3J28_00405 [Acidobacteria bacterium RIFCSPLOWO2_12_FULL_60_22]|nr:MAG: hypothetical protein A3J28_00405 [Acidobacteria bacterium RIFCSPLOWO2_12_FULL_60_22]
MRERATGQSQGTKGSAMQKTEPITATAIEATPDALVKVKSHSSRTCAGGFGRVTPRCFSI